MTSAGSRTGASPGTPGTTSPRYFINVVGFGFDVAVIEASRGARFLRGELLYKATALRQLFTFRGVRLTLTPDREPGVDGRYLLVTVSNGPFFGGGIPIAPAAELADGMLDACAIGDANALGRAGLFHRASTGRHVLRSGVHSRRDTRFVLNFGAAPKYEVDGDVWQAEGTEVVIEVAPNALPIVIPA